MDAIRLGRSLRALRIRRRLRQSDVAAVARVARSQVGRIEIGQLARVPIGDVVAVAAALGADLDVRARWRGEALDRLLDEAHARLVEATVALLGGRGWQTAVEVSFSFAGERGSVDVVAFHAPSSTVLVVEVKSVVPDAQAMLATLDRKARLGLRIASLVGWSASTTSRLLVIADTSTARARIGRLAGTFDAAYPERGWTVRRWLAAPDRPISGLLFLPDAHSVGGRAALVGRERVTAARRPSSERRLPQLGH